MFTEDELENLSFKELKVICSQIALRYGCPLENIVPYGAKKDLLIESILESQESIGGSHE